MADVAGHSGQRRSSSRRDNRSVMRQDTATCSADSGTRKPGHEHAAPSRQRSAVMRWKRPTSSTSTHVGSVLDPANGYITALRMTAPPSRYDAAVQTRDRSAWASGAFSVRGVDDVALIGGNLICIETIEPLQALHQSEHRLSKAG